MTARRWPVRASLAAVVLVAGAVAAQETVIRVNVNLVRVLATVKTAEGQLVGSLQKEDFEVFDNGARQDVAIFERHTEQPLSVALLIDNSGSTAKDLKYEIDSVHRFLNAFFREGNPQDAMAVYTFNYEVRKLNHFTRNAASISAGLKGIRSEAGTCLYDAIWLGARDLQDRDGRKVLVVVTDGGDTTSVKDFHAALQAAHLADAVLYSILVMPITNDAGRNIGGENALYTLGQRTGGRVFQPSVAAALDTAFADILRELRTQYLLAYYPKDVPLTKNRFHALQVKLKKPELRVSARNGYYGEVEATSAPAGRISARPPKD